MRRFKLVFGVAVLATAVAASCTSERKPPFTTPTGATVSSTSSTGGGGAGGTMTTGTTTTSTVTATASTGTGTGCNNGLTCSPACLPTENCVDVGNCDGACSTGQVGEPCGKDADCGFALTCIGHFCGCPSTACFVPGNTSSSVNSSTATGGSACPAGFNCVDIGNCSPTCTDGQPNSFCGQGADCGSGMCQNHQCL
jgi:hypothetical protein